MAAAERRLSQKNIGPPAFWASQITRICDSLVRMDAARDALPEDIAALKAALAVERAKALEVAAELAVARAKASEDRALIAQQKLRIAKLERQIYGQRSERSSRLIDQLALDVRRAGSQRHGRRTGGGAGRRQDDHGARIYAQASRAQYVPRASSPRARGDRSADGLRVLRRQSPAQARRRRDPDAGMQPRQWKVIETVREKFTCRDCEKISQAPAPFHAVARGWAGPSLLAMIMFEKFGQHQPLNRQAERYALEGVPIALSTMADAVGSVCAALDPLLRLVEAHVMAAERLHGDDTTVPVLAKGKTDTGRCWVYVRDDKPFGGAGPPAAMFYYSRDRKGEHPQAHLAGYAGILQADAYDGYNKLYLAGRSPGPIQEAACWVHAPAPVLRHGRHRGERASQGRGQKGNRAVADRDRGRAPHRRAVRDRAIHQRQERRRSAWPFGRP